ncbi:E3 SUMO-protein ligase PIAS2-like isoform X3 [Ruditapes philippinarum]|uniref:E3 SUMO-protein ligase PIAS2-like isoform X3 n=1 Tax=Ruditapes philippinarum TaxID=129788 RepID=UPI00295AD353|nr:E3 SUMO-protein ligase PIAS2-like isoform X3 [Ruditapes philippinarum]
MAEAEELKKMVMSFRVSELQVLASYAGWSKYGRKVDLLQRALYQIERQLSPRIHQKIRELYRQIHNPYAVEPPRSRNLPRGQQQVSDPRQLEQLARRYGTSKVTSQQLQNTQSGAVDFSKRGLDSLSAASTLPVHPDVRFRPLPFFDIMGELLKPTSLAPKGPSRYQETYFVFHLTPQQAQDIAMSRDVRATAKWEYTVQVQLRFCFLETSCEQDDNFPPSICVRVNGKVAQLPNPIPTTKPGVEPKRPGRPVDITSLCRLSPTMPNHVEISWASEYGRGYVVSINLVKRLTSDILLQRLKQFGNRHADHSRAMIKEKLQHDADSEIATTSLRVSLTCPLGKMRLQLPCRAGTCTHIQCFDATTFLMMNEKKATWLCPVCDKPTPFHKLIIDGLFVEILKQTTDVDEIQFIEDGTWAPIKSSKQTHTINNTPSRQTASSSKEKTVNLCGDSEDSPTASPAKKPKMEVIDLTLSDSEDEGEPVRPQSSHEISSGPIIAKIAALHLVSSTPSLIMNAPPISAPLSPEISSAVHKLPPLPPLTSYRRSDSNVPSTNFNNPGNISSHSLNESGLNLSVNSRNSSPVKYESHTLHSPPHTSSMVPLPSPSSSSPQSWLTALSGQTQGQKRPPPAHSNNQPPPKRTLMDKVGTGSPSSSNSNMSPLVDLDQLCSILDSDRDRNSEEIAHVLPFPPDFPLTLTSNPTPNGNSLSSRNYLNVSPSDIISLD